MKTSMKTAQNFINRYVWGLRRRTGDEVNLLKDVRSGGATTFIEAHASHGKTLLHLEEVEGGVGW